PIGDGVGSEGLRGTGAAGGTPANARLSRRRRGTSTLKDQTPGRKAPRGWRSGEVAVTLQPRPFALRTTVHPSFIRLDAATRSTLASTSASHALRGTS